MNSEKSVLKIILLLVASTVIVLCFSLNMPPDNFPIKQDIVVASGSSAKQVVTMLKQHHVVKSVDFSLLAGKFLGTTNTLVAGTYQFSEPLSSFEIMYRIGVGRFGVVRERITLLEGWNNNEYAAELSKKLPLFNTQEFLALTKNKQGMLFPDTYFFPRTATTADVIFKLEENFSKRTKTLVSATGLASDKTFEDHIIMASILEREATNVKDAYVISDILWRRMKIGMALQVDATLGYVTGKTSAELTQGDLRSKSPYNTYTNKGLPPTAIGNPGIDMINAARTPTPNEYLYYLHDKNGEPHYAKTFKEHVANKIKYLR